MTPNQDYRLHVDSNPLSVLDESRESWTLGFPLQSDASNDPGKRIEEALVDFSQLIPGKGCRLGSQRKGHDAGNAQKQKA